MTWNKSHFRMRMLGTSLRTENTEEFLSERTVQNCYVQPVNQRMNNVAKKTTYEPLFTSIPF